MSLDSLHLKALSAADAAEQIRKLAAVVFKGRSVSFSVATNVSGLQTSCTVPAASLTTDATLDEFIKYARKRKHLVCRQLTVHDSNNPNQQLNYTSDDGIIARLLIQSNGDSDFARLAIEAIEKHLSVTSYADIVQTSGDESQQAALRLRERSVADLQNAVAQLADFTGTLTLRESEARERLQQELERSYRERSEALEADYRSRLQSLEERKQAADDELAKQQRAFEDRVAGFQRHEAKYMRRELLKRIEELLDKSEQMKLSQTTAAKRWWVHVFVWVMLTGATVLATAIGTVLFGTTDPQWHLSLPFAVATVTFFGTLVYYLKWNDRWFREHADGELAVKQYKADILRASWIAELVSEWEKENDGEMPPHLLEAFTRNMFRQLGQVRESEHPYDHVANLIKRATEVNIGRGVFSVRTAKPTRNGKATLKRPLPPGV